MHPRPMQETVKGPSRRCRMAESYGSLTGASKTSPCAGTRHAACVENIEGGTMNTLTKLSLSLHAACLALCVTAAAQAAGLEEPSADPMKTAQQLDRQGLDLEARFYYGKALMRNPQDLAALSAIGLLEVRMGESEAAHVHLQRLQRACTGCK